MNDMYRDIWMSAEQMNGSLKAILYEVLLIGFLIE